MPSPFSRTLRSLESDGPRRLFLQVLPVLLFFLLWSAWFFCARVAVYEVSGRARVEVEQAAYPLDAPVDGRIAAVHWRLGQQVRRGAALIELETAEQRLRLAEEGTRRTALTGQVAALEREIAAAEEERAGAVAAARATLAEAEERFAEAREAASLAEGDASRQGELARGGLVSQAELLRMRSLAEQRRAAARAAGLARDRAASELARAGNAGRAGIEERRRLLADLSGQHVTSAAAAERLREEVARRLVTAPVDGRVGEIVPLAAGSYVEAGARLGVLVPHGTLRVVAEFPPASAIGRIRPGQAAWVRLAGFPAAQYGTLPATVAEVGNEARGGAVRVELAVRHDGAAHPALPLVHGLPGTVEIEVERLAPATLVLRAVGKRLDRPAASTPGPGED